MGRRPNDRGLWREMAPNIPWGEEIFLAKGQTIAWEVVSPQVGGRGGRESLEETHPLLPHA